jgi:hypothetical protein
MSKLLYFGIISFFFNFAFADNTYRFEIYGSSTQQTWNPLSPYNTDNNNLEVPTWTHTLELRPDIQINLGDLHSVVVRSRHFLQSFETQFTNPDKTEHSSDENSDLSDLFLSSVWGGSFATTLGLQNYQWGPAEIFSPSNPFFHFDNNQRSFFYKEKGRVLARANWNPSPKTTNWSVVAIYEPIDNRTQFWTAEKDFHPRSVLKIEYQFDNPANAIALVGGQGEDKKGFVGEYFTFSPKDGISLYVDAKHSPSRTNYVPQKNAFNRYDMVNVEEKNKTYTLAVIGFRWEGRVDFRQEFIYNEAGYDDDEWTQARLSALTLSPNILTNAKRFSAPGLEFRTKAYSYTSIRIPDLGLSRMASVSARWFSSLMHDSAALQLNFEYNWDDHTVISLESIQFVGVPEEEFRSVNDRQASLGFRWSY